MALGKLITAVSFALCAIAPVSAFAQQNVNGCEIRPQTYCGAADLHGANLQFAHLYSADLQKVNLSKANLQQAQLYSSVFDLSLIHI